MKRNKKRYQTKEKPRKQIEATGRILLQYNDDEALEAKPLEKGDFYVYAECRALHTLHNGDYTQTGMVGYFKVDIFDGKELQPVILNGVFTKEHQFGKHEQPIDVYAIVHERLVELKSSVFSRSYREHYQVVMPDE